MRLQIEPLARDPAYKPLLLVLKLHDMFIKMPYLLGCIVAVSVASVLM